MFILIVIFSYIYIIAYVGVEAAQLWELSDHVLLIDIFRLTWRQTGNQGDEWHVGQAPISAAKNWLLQFTASVGSGYQGDIAIDDVIIEVTLAPIKFSVS